MTTRHLPNRLSRLAPALLLALFVFPYFLRLGESSIWDANEAFYAVTPREMIERGDFIAPTFNYEVRAQKPPLTYWAIIPFYKLLGVSELSVRLPGALAAAGLLLAVFLMGKALHGLQAGLLAAAVTATAARIFVLARKLPIDILLNFWLMAAAYCLVRAAQKGSRWAWAAAYACMALGFLTKGPVALFIPLAAYVGWSAAAHRFSARAMRPFAGASVFLAIVAPWYLSAYAAHGWTYIAPFFLRDNLARFATESFGPSRGVFYYLPAFLSDFFPWSFLSLAGLWLAFKEQGFARLMRSLESGFPLLWSALVLMVFSLSRNKQEYYIASVYPMMAVFLSGVLTRAWRDKDGLAHPSWRIVLVAVSCLLLVAAVLATVLGARLLPEFDSAWRHLPPALLALGACTAAGLAWAGRGREGVWMLAGALWLLLASAVWIYVPALEARRPVRELCALISERLRPGDQAGYYGVTVPSMAFYLRRPIFEEYIEDSFVARLRAGHRIYCILGDEHLEELRRFPDLEFQVLARRPRLATQMRAFIESSSLSREFVLVSSAR